MNVSLIISYASFGSSPVYKILNKEYVQIDFVVAVLVRILNLIKDATPVNLEYSFIFSG